MAQESRKALAGQGFGKTLRYYRKRRGLTQAELGDALKVDQTTVSGWERSAEPPRDWYLYMESLGALLGIDAQVLESGEMGAPTPLSGDDWLDRAIRDLAPDMPASQAREFLELLNQAGPEDREATRRALRGMIEASRQETKHRRLSERRADYNADGVDQDERPAQ